MLRKTAIEGSNTVTEKLVAEVQPTEHPAFNEFVATIEALRSPDGCPWDKEQTHKSISGNMVEEAYEAVDAIEADDVAHMREELGDVLLQVVLQSQIAADAGEFTIDDVCRDVNAKIVRRHPHVFSDVVAGDANEVLDVWDQIKMAEKESADAAADPAAVAAVELEMGDVLFSLVNVARKMGVQAEEALRATCGKFRARWAFMEGAAAGQGRRVEDLSMEEMEELWRLSKVLEG